MRTKIVAVAVALGVLFASGIGGASTSSAAAGSVMLRNGSGISVTAETVVDPRLIDATLTSTVINHPVGVRVLLPTGYDPSSATRYPVLYLLHGGFGSYRDWTDAGNAEALTSGLPLIVVMPDAGKGGWYSDWSNFGDGGSPAWETFHIGQLIPWVDANFSTVSARSGRAIAGLSMGGFGAMSYAARHPNLFVSVSSFSGAVDIQNPIVAALIQASPIIDGGLPGSIYGIGPFDQPGLAAHNPANLAANLRGMHVALYAGNGQTGPLDTPSTITLPDVQETVVHANNVLLDQRLTALGISHTFDDYGPGTHSFPYWTRDLGQELPAIMATFAHPTPAGNAVTDGGFESPGMGAWACNGRCGADHGLGLARAGSGDGWVRNDHGWNDVHTTVQVAAHTPYRLTGWVRSSSNSYADFLGVRTPSGAVIGERRFTTYGSYTQVSVDLNTGSNTSVVVYGGAWTDAGDTWLQLDDVSLTPL